MLKYKSMENYEGIGGIQEPENSVQKTLTIPLTSQATVERALELIINDMENFINSTLEELGKNNSDWVGRLRRAALNELSGQNNYLLFSNLVIFCALEEFKNAGRPFPIILFGTDKASQAELLNIPNQDEEKNSLRQSVTQFMFELQNQDPNLFHIIIYLYNKLGIKNPSGMLGVFHVRKSITNQLESDYWQRKIEE